MFFRCRAWRRRGVGFTLVLQPQRSTHLCSRAQMAKLVPRAVLAAVVLLLTAASQDISVEVGRFVGVVDLGLLPTLHVHPKLLITSSARGGTGDAVRPQLPAAAARAEHGAAQGAHARSCRTRRRRRGIPDSEPGMLSWVLAVWVGRRPWCVRSCFSTHGMRQTVCTLS